MCYLPIDGEGFHDGMCIKTKKVYCCPCYFDFLVFARCNGENCQMELRRILIF